MNKKIVLFAALFCLILAIVSVFAYLRTGGTVSKKITVNTQKTKEMPSQAKHVNNVNETTSQDGSTGSKNEVSKNKADLDQKSEADSQSHSVANENISTTLKVFNGSTTKTYKVELASGSSAYDQLREARNKYKLPFVVKSYSYGVFVESINGLKNNLSGSTYWFLYINGRSSNTGASTTYLKKGDTVTWKYEKSS